MYVVKTVIDGEEVISEHVTKEGAVQGAFEEYARLSALDEESSDVYEELKEEVLNNLRTKGREDFPVNYLSYVKIDKVQ